MKPGRCHKPETDSVYWTKMSVIQCCGRRNVGLYIMRYYMVKFIKVVKCQTKILLEI